MITLTTLLMASSAHAGMFVGAIGAAIAGNSELGTVLAYCGGGIAFVGILAGAVTGSPAIVGAYMILTLGADGSLPKSEIANQLQARYSFIDNQQVVSELVDKVKNAYNLSQKNEENEAYVSVSEKDILDVLAKTDLSQEEISIIVTELQ